MMILLSPPRCCCCWCWCCNYHRRRIVNGIIEFVVLSLLLLSILGSFIFVTAFQQVSSSSSSHKKSQSYTSNALIDQSGGILYRTSIIQNKQDWDSIYQEVISLLPYLQPESKLSIAQYRYGITLSSKTAPTILRILNDPNSSITQFINRITKSSYVSSVANTDLQLTTSPPFSSSSSYVLAPNIPVEIRSYATKNANMNWHIDDILYSPIPQIEIILTIINTSNCQTMYQIKETIHSIETQTNSILCLRAGRTSHCVTPLQYGQRIIIKCAYIPISTTTSIDNNVITNYIGDNDEEKKSTMITKKQQQQQQFQSISTKHRKYRNK